MAELDDLLREERELQVETFTNDDAWWLGIRLVGTAADDDAWIERKVAVVRRFGHSSLYVCRALQAEGRTIQEKFLLDEAEYAPHGGAFPITVRGVGVVGVVTVSGLSQEEDHQLVVEVLRAFVGR